MRRSHLLLPLAFCFLPLSGGCAKSPVGLTTRASNRFATTLSLAGTLNPNYYYGVAFDDTGIDGVGPVAIVGNTPIQNGVVGGSFRLLVLYHLNRFQVFYRSTPSDTRTEREISGSSGLFVFTPRATTTGLEFTIDLDARLPAPDNSTFIFPRGTTATSLATNRFNINAVATNTIIRGGTNEANLIKPVDALGAQQVATPYSVQIGGTITTSISDVTGAASDENFGVDSFYSNVPFSSIDISGLQIGITRSG